MTIICTMTKVSTSLPSHLLGSLAPLVIAICANPTR